jgi:hypothetical protein
VSLLWCWLGSSLSSCLRLRCCILFSSSCFFSHGFLRPCSHLVGCPCWVRSSVTFAVRGIGGCVLCPARPLPIWAVVQGWHTGMRRALGGVGLDAACSCPVVCFLLVMAHLFGAADCLPGLQSLLVWWSCVQVSADDVVIIGLPCPMLFSSSM